MAAPFYFAPFERRQPPPPLKFSPTVELLWQVLASMNLAVGAWYIWWRWSDSLNPDALWFAVPLVLSETCAYIGLILFTFNLWRVADTPHRSPPSLIRECVYDPENYPELPLNIDVFFPTVNEEPELVRLSIRDAKQIRYPRPINIKIYVLDDGCRTSMRQVAEEEGVSYIEREENIGFKAGNLAHAMEETGGHFILICDADTRPFPTILEHTLGYFRDPDVAWVQTPQWFYDIPEGYPLHESWRRCLGLPGYWMACGIECLTGSIQVNRDPLANDPKMFYDIILRRRNWTNAAFCCGAGSIHRRDAVMEAALKSYADFIKKSIVNQNKLVQNFINQTKKYFKKEKIRTELADLLSKDIEKNMMRIMMKNQEFSPYKYHVSEDIYTSMMLHSDQERRRKKRTWKSVLHPQVESKMLSPQDLHSWMVQRFKYAGGTLDIMLRDRMILHPGLSLSQRLMYGATFWSYLGGIWNLFFLLGPIIYLFSGISPVSAYDFNFYKHILPFLLLTELALMAGTWGISGFKGKLSYMSFFSVNLHALSTVLRGNKIKFPVTPKQRQKGNFFYLVLPQFSVVLLTLTGLLYAWSLYFNESSGYTRSGLIINTFWGGYNIIALSTLIRAAFWKPA